ncbi:MAG TPA: von Willebrand factor type A domain-containing protein, partial [Opitutales bacterium]|nr:von Willebrand factor type A domain-containing protein [Opitutales bacterium]
MNPQPPNDGTPPPPSPREEFEARLAALALGESGEFDAETLRTRLSADPELAALYRRFEAAALAYKNTFEDEQAAAALPPLEPPPEHLSTDRAARLAKIFAGTAPEVSAAPVKLPTAPRQRRPRKILPFPAWVQIFAAAACLVLLAVMLIPASNTSVHLSKALLQQSAATPSTPERVASAASAKTTTNEPQPQPAPVALNFQTPTAANASTASGATPIMSAAQLARSLDNENKTVRDDAGAGTGGGGAEPFFATNGSLLAKDQSLEPPAGPPPGAPAMQSGPALAANTPPVNTWANTDPQMLRDFQVRIAGGNNEASAAAPMPTEAPPMPPPPPPPPPPPAVAANNYRGNAFGGAQSAGGGAFGGGGARRGGAGGFGGRAPRGGLGGRTAGGPQAGRGGAAADVPAPGAAAAPAANVNTNTDTTEPATVAATTLTVSGNIQNVTFNSNLSSAGSLTGNDAGSNNFGGDAGLRSGNGLADAGGQGGVSGNDQRAANSFDNRNAGAVPVTGVSSANSLIRGGTESYGNNAFSGNMYAQGGNVTLGSNVALNNTTGNYIVGGGNLGFGNLTAATIGGLPGNQNAGANNNHGANNAGTPEAPGIVAFALGGIASEANSGSTLAQNGGGMVFSGGGLQWAAGTSTDISNSIQGQFGNVQANLTPNGSEALAAGANPQTSTPFNGVGGIVKTGSSTLTLNANSAYTGGTVISGGTLTFNGNTESYTGGTLTPGTNAPNTTYTGVLSGSGNLIAGNDTLTLTGTNNFSGNITVQAGTINVNSLNHFGVNTANDSGRVATEGGGSLSISQDETSTGVISSTGTLQLGSGTFVTSGTLDNTPVGASNTPGQTVANNVSQQIATAAPTAPVPALMPAAPPTSEPGFQDNAKKAVDADQPVARPRSVVKFPAPVNTADNAFSTFALNVNDVSYQLARTALQNHRWPDPGATRTEEFLNAFNYHDPAPATGEACALHYD